MSVGTLRPAQEDIACRLHDALAGDDALPLVLEGARLRKRLEDRTPRFLDLKDEAVVFVRHQQRDGTARPDAADSDDFDRHVHEFVGVHQRRDVVAQRGAVRSEDFGRIDDDLAVGRRVVEFRRLIDDTPPETVTRGVLLGDQLVGIVRCGIARGLAQSGRRVRYCEDLRGVDAGVPDFEFRHRRTLRQAFAVCIRRRANRVAGAAFGHVRRARSALVDARCEALDVPLPRGGQRFVEIVDIEDDVAFRRCEYPEVLDVAVAAGLDDDAGDMVAGAEIEGHDARRAAKERERRPAHASVSNRNQIVDATFVRSRQQHERIRTVVRGGPVAVAGARAVRAKRLSLSQELRDRQPSLRRRVHSSSFSMSSKWLWRSCSNR